LKKSISEIAEVSLPPLEMANLNCNELIITLERLACYLSAGSHHFTQGKKPVELTATIIIAMD